MVKLLYSREKALNIIEKSANDATLKDFIKFTEQFKKEEKIMKFKNWNDYVDSLNKEELNKELLSDKEIQKALKKIGDD